MKGHGFGALPDSESAEQPRPESPCGEGRGKAPMRHGLLHTTGIWRCGRHVARGLSKGYLAQGK